MGIPYERPTATGLIATLRGTAPDAYDASGAPRRRLLMRADIDALPVTEKTGEPFASQNPGASCTPAGTTATPRCFWAPSACSRR